MRKMQKDRRTERQKQFYRTVRTAAMYLDVKVFCYCKLVHLSVIKEVFYQWKLISKQSKITIAKIASIR